jgi:hypothetical protein
MGGLDGLASYDNTVFKAEKPPKDWTAMTQGVSLSFDKNVKLPSLAAILAATRVETPEDREAVIELEHDQGKSFARFDITVWINDTVVRKLGANKSIEQKPFRLLKAGNTMLVECRSRETAAVAPGVLALTFKDAKSGKPLDGLLFDVEKRE